MATIKLCCNPPVSEIVRKSCPKGWTVFQNSQQENDMLFLVATALGLASAATRSTGALIAVALLVPFTFLAAVILSPFHVPLFGLLIAILGVNTGIALLIGATLASEYRHRVA
jgi:hypothetical protein